MLGIFEEMNQVERTKDLLSNHWRFVVTDWRAFLWLFVDMTYVDHFAHLLETAREYAPFAIKNKNVAAFIRQQQTQSQQKQG